VGCGLPQHAGERSRRVVMIGAFKDRDSINPLGCNWCPPEPRSRPIFIRHAPAALTHALLEIADTEIGSITTRCRAVGIAQTRSAVMELRVQPFIRAPLTSQMARRS